MSIRKVGPTEAKKLMDAGCIYVDVRTEEEFEDGHPAGAHNVPISHMGDGAMVPNPDFVTVARKRFQLDQALVVGCKGGGRAARAADALNAAGFTNVIIQGAGYVGSRGAFGETLEEGWSRVGLPIETGLPEGRAYRDRD